MKSEPKAVLNEYLKIAAEYSIPLFWGKKNGLEWNIKNNGTAFILDTGQSKFVVTAAHVYRSYVKYKKEGFKGESQLSDINFELEDRLICAPDSNSIDIATFRISDDEISKIGKSVLRGGNVLWPPPRPVEGQAIVVAGYPGIERRHMVGKSFCFGTYSFNTPASSISSRHFGCSLERKYWIDVFGLGLPPDNYDMGGISGAPALTLVKSDAGIVSWQLAGVVYEAGASIGEIVFAHHADFIESNGNVAENA